MKHRRHGLIISMILMASFFVISCGIPQFCNLGNTSIKFSTEDTGEITLSIKSSREEEDLQAKIAKGPGLVLFYLISDNPLNSSDIKDIRTAFSSEYGSGSNGKKLVNAIDAAQVLEKYNLCIFSCDGAIPKAPFYNADTQQSGKGMADYTMTLSFADSKVKATDSNGKSYEYGRFTASDQSFKSNRADITSSMNDYSNLSGSATSYTINIFAAFTAVEGAFTNLYWSELTSIGSFKVSL